MKKLEESIVNNVFQLVTMFYDFLWKFHVGILSYHTMNTARESLEKQQFYVFKDMYPLKLL